jgi:hypothetical protein
MGKYDHINFVPPDSVAAAAAKGLEYRQKAGGKGGLSSSQAKAEGVGSGVQRAVNLKNKDKLSPETVKRMKAFFDRHEKNKSIDPKHKDEPYKDRGYVAWLVWGGDPGYTWAKKVVTQMENADKKEKIKKAGAAARVILAFYKNCIAEETQLEMGKKVEREHADLYEMVSKYLKKRGVEMPVPREKFFEMIAKAHIKELPNYYSKLKEMENNTKEALDFTSIAPILTSKEKMDDRELARALRLSISAEQDAVHLYELLADSSNDQRVKKLMNDIANEEKVHIGEFQRMLKEIDKDNAGLIAEGEEEAEDLISGN